MPIAFVSFTLGRDPSLAGPTEWHHIIVVVMGFSIDSLNMNLYISIQSTAF